MNTTYLEPHERPHPLRWSNGERYALQNALFCAAVEYDKIAMQMHHAGEFILAEQFNRQAKEARLLHDALGAEYVITIR